MGTLVESQPGFPSTPLVVEEQLVDLTVSQLEPSVVTVPEPRESREIASNELSEKVQKEYREELYRLEALRAEKQEREEMIRKLWNKETNERKQE